MSVFSFVSQQKIVILPNVRTEYYKRSFGVAALIYGISCLGTYSSQMRTNGVNDNISYCPWHNHVYYHVSDAFPNIYRLVKYDPFQTYNDKAI